MPGPSLFLARTGDTVVGVFDDDRTADTHLRAAVSDSQSGHGTLSELQVNGGAGVDLRRYARHSDGSVAVTVLPEPQDAGAVDRPLTVAETLLDAIAAVAALEHNTWHGIAVDRAQLRKIVADTYAAVPNAMLAAAGERRIRQQARDNA